jgi:hypothetical protein
MTLPYAIVFCMAYEIIHLLFLLEYSSKINTNAMSLPVIKGIVSRKFAIGIVGKLKILYTFFSPSIFKNIVVFI